ncbi:MAG: OmpA family protein [Endozoicomonas sp.]
MTTRKFRFSALILTLLLTVGCATQQTPSKPTSDSPVACAVKGGAVLGVPGAAYNLATGGTAFVAGAIMAGTACALASSEKEAEVDRIQLKPIDIKPFSGLKELTIHFDFDSAAIRKNEFEDLNKLLGSFEKGNKISVTGHTCEIGTRLYNQVLSEQRAWAVKKYLEEMGVPGDRIKTSGKGETEPVRGNDTEEMLEENRRAEIRIIKQP